MLKYWLWLSTRRGLGARGAYLVARHFATPEAAYYADEEAYKAVPSLRDRTGLLDKDLTLAEHIRIKCYNAGIGILTIQDAAYPERLRNIDDPPLVLYYKGNLPDLNGPAVAVIGTREVSAYGATQARRMGYSISKCGCMVVSGGAKGADTEALKGALQGGTPAIAVLGGGVDVVYPARNRDLFRDIASYGCLISEYPPGTECRSAHFPARNRIISGLSLGVLVVEAPERSGALLTAYHALNQGRDVFAIPANVDSASCKGNLKLLRDGAIVAADAWDVLQDYARMHPEQIRRVVCKPLNRQPQKQEKLTVAQEQKPAIDNALQEKLSQLQGDEKLLADLLAAGPINVDNIVDEVQLPAGRVLASLTLLEVKGIVRRLGARRYALVTEAAE